MNDPMERLIQDALNVAGHRYLTDEGGHNPTKLDFSLPDLGVEIEVKRFHTPRVAEQMARAENVIVAQGDGAVRFLACLLAGSRHLAPKEAE